MLRKEVEVERRGLAETQKHGNVGHDEKWEEPQCHDGIDCTLGEEVGDVIREVGCGYR